MASSLQFRVLLGLRRMGSNGVNVTSEIDVAEGSESTIEIKIKTLDSQTYTLRVNKQVIQLCYLFVIEEFTCIIIACWVHDLHVSKQDNEL